VAQTLMTRAIDANDLETAEALKRCHNVGGNDADALTPYQDGLIKLAILEYQYQLDANGCPIFGQTLSRLLTEARRFDQDDLIGALVKCSENQGSALSSFEKFQIYDAQRIIATQKQKEREIAAAEQKKAWEIAAAERKEAEEIAARAAAARTREIRALTEYAEKSQKNSVFYPTADLLNYLQNDRMTYEDSTLRATTSEIRLTNELLMIIIQQNDQLIRSINEQSNDQ